MKEKELKTARVQWYVSGDVECPHCEHEFDFTEIDEFYEYSNIGENKKEFFSPIEHTCHKCGKDFLINGSDY